MKEWFRYTVQFTYNSVMISETYDLEKIWYKVFERIHCMLIISLKMSNNSRNM